MDLSERREEIDDAIDWVLWYCWFHLMCLCVGHMWFDSFSELFTIFDYYFCDYTKILTAIAETLLWAMEYPIDNGTLDFRSAYFYVQPVTVVLLLRMQA